MATAEQFDPTETTTISLTRGTKRELDRVMPDGDTTYDELLADLAGDREPTVYGRVSEVSLRAVREHLTRDDIDLESVGTNGWVDEIESEIEEILGQRYGIEVREE